jgi:hypothetical protein
MTMNEDSYDVFENIVRQRIREMNNERNGVVTSGSEDVDEAGFYLVNGSITHSEYQRIRATGCSISQVMEDRKEFSAITSARNFEKESDNMAAANRKYMASLGVPDNVECDDRESLTEEQKALLIPVDDVLHILGVPAEDGENHLQMCPAACLTARLGIASLSIGSVDSFRVKCFDPTCKLNRMSNSVDLFKAATGLTGRTFYQMVSVLNHLYENGKVFDQWVLKRDRVGVLTASGKVNRFGAGSFTREDECKPISVVLAPNSTCRNTGEKREWRMKGALMSDLHSLQDGVPSVLKFYDYSVTNGYTKITEFPINDQILSADIPDDIKVSVVALDHAGCTRNRRKKRDIIIVDNHVAAAAFVAAGYLAISLPLYDKRRPNVLNCIFREVGQYIKSYNGRIIIFNPENRPIQYKNFGSASTAVDVRVDPVAASNRYSDSSVYGVTRADFIRVISSIFYTSEKPTAALINKMCDGDCDPGDVVGYLGATPLVKPGTAFWPEAISVSRIDTAMQKQEYVYTEAVLSVRGEYRVEILSDGSHHVISDSALNMDQVKGLVIKNNDGEFSHEYLMSAWYFFKRNNCKFEDNSFPLAMHLPGLREDLMNQGEDARDGWFMCDDSSVFEEASLIARKFINNLTNSDENVHLEFTTENGDSEHVNTSRNENSRGGVDSGVPETSVGVSGVTGEVLVFEDVMVGRDEVYSGDHEELAVEPHQTVVIDNPGKRRRGIYCGPRFWKGKESQHQAHELCQQRGLPSPAGGLPPVEKNIPCEDHRQSHRGSVAVKKLRSLRHVCRIIRHLRKGSPKVLNFILFQRLLVRGRYGWRCDPRDDEKRQKVPGGRRGEVGEPVRVLHQSDVPDVHHHHQERETRVGNVRAVPSRKVPAAHRYADRRKHQAHRGNGVLSVRRGLSQPCPAMAGHLVRWRGCTYRRKLTNTGTSPPE